MEWIVVLIFFSFIVQGEENHHLCSFFQILPNFHFITPFKYLDFLVTVAQLVVRPPGRQEAVGSNPGRSQKFLWRKKSVLRGRLVTI